MDVPESALVETFVRLDQDGNGRIWTWELLAKLGQAGIQPEDPRVRAALADVLEADGQPGVRVDAQPRELDLRQYAGIAQHGDGLVGRALSGRLVVAPDEFQEFRRSTRAMYADLLPNRDGEVAGYIPTLADADPDKFGIAIYTADGQVFTIGDTTDEFSVQSTAKPFSFGIALEQLGPEEVHRWIGQEQSGGAFNDPLLSLGKDGRPHNPMINAGAIGTLALVDAGKDLSHRLRTMENTWMAMTGERPLVLGSTFGAERDTAFGNLRFANALAAAGKLYGAGPTDRRAPEDATEFYTMVCSYTMNAERLAKAGVTLANGGIAPFSGKRVFSPETAGRVLAVMAHSGMYNDSGNFTGEVGLPAKSGVSGNVMMVVPSKGMAVVVYSPRLDAVGNSVRGVEVCKRLVNEFGLHPYRGLGADRPRAVAAQAVATPLADQKAEFAHLMRLAQDGMAVAGSRGPAVGSGTGGTGGTGSTGTDPQNAGLQNASGADAATTATTATTTKRVKPGHQL
jgi:glutaminase